jgi:large subunit ribosomal protein LP0
MSDLSKKGKKRKLINRLYANFSKYKQVVLVSLANVGSSQVQDARHQLRKQKKGEMLVAKNTVIKKAISLRIENPNPSDPDYDERKQLWSALPQLEKLAGLCKGKIALIFSHSPVFELKPLIEANKVPTAARVGATAPLDVTIPPGPTGMDPSQIAFFHALSIPTKIQKGQIEMTKEYRVCTKGKKVANSEAVLLQKLNMKPFQYGMEMRFVYDDGAIMGPEVFNLSIDELLSKFRKGVTNLASLSMALGMPNELSVPHMIINGFKNCASIGLETGLKFKQLEGLSSGPAKVAVKEAPKEAPKKAEKKVEEKPVEDDMAPMGDMFGD